MLEKNHIQGNCASHVDVGLFHNNEIVAVMCFSKFNRANNKTDAEWELIRFVTLRDHNIIGGASKLFSYFIKHYKGNIVSYSNITKTTGKLYSILGFVNKKIGNPNYVWCKQGLTRSRYQCQMKDERAIMERDGYYRVYDAGTKVWIYRNN